MRLANPFAWSLLVAPAIAQYTRPDVVSSNTAVTHQDNIVAPYADIPVSPLDTIVEAPMPTEYTAVLNVRRGRLEYYYFNVGQNAHIPIGDFPIPIGRIFRAEEALQAVAKGCLVAAVIGD